MMSPYFWAEFFLYLHFTWVLVVIAAVPLIIMGKLLRWSFVTNPYFRYIHLSMILIVVMLALLGIECPFTTWEMHFRAKTGELGYPSTFMSYWVSYFLYHEFELWIFTTVYIVFGILIVALLFWVPPRKRIQ